MKAAEPGQFVMCRAVWTATIVGMLLTAASGLLVPSLPWLIWPTLIALVVTGLLWVTSIIFLQRTDRYLGALAMGLFVGGGAIGSGLGQMDERRVWMIILALAVMCMQVGILVMALRQDRKTD